MQIFYYLCYYGRYQQIVQELIMRDPVHHDIPFRFFVELSVGLFSRSYFGMIFGYVGVNFL